MNVGGVKDANTAESSSSSADWFVQSDEREERKDIWAVAQAAAPPGRLEKCPENTHTHTTASFD